MANINQRGGGGGGDGGVDDDVANGDNDRQERDRIREQQQLQQLLEDMDKARLAANLDEAIDALNNRMDRHDADQVAHEQAVAHAIEGFADVIRFGMGLQGSQQQLDQQYD